MNNNRFIRDYSFTFTVGGKTYEVLPPLRISFSGKKSIFGQLNTLDIRVFNLDPEKRAAMVKDIEVAKYIPIELQIGYDGRLETIFKGTVFSSSTKREGSYFVTEIQSMDGYYGVSSAFTSTVVTTKNQAIDQIVKDIPYVEKGKITAQNELVRPKVLVGNSYDILDSIVSPGHYRFIDDGVLSIIGKDEVVSGFIPVVSAETGLMNTPRS